MWSHIIKSNILRNFYSGFEYTQNHYHLWHSHRHVCDYISRLKNMIWDFNESERASCALTRRKNENFHVIWQSRETLHCHTHNHGWRSAHFSKLLLWMDTKRGRSYILRKSHILVITSRSMRISESAGATSMLIFAELWLITAKGCENSKR